MHNTISHVVDVSDDLSGNDTKIEFKVDCHIEIRQSRIFIIPRDASNRLRGAVNLFRSSLPQSSATKTHPHRTITRLEDTNMGDLRPSKRRRIAVKKTSKPGTIALIAANAKSSPLLKVPGEVRKMIYRYVLGDRFIHIFGHNEYDASKGYSSMVYRYAFCRADATEAAAYEHSIHGPTDVPTDDDCEYYVASCHNRHVICFDGINGQQSSTTFLALLGVCRQIYYEASEVLWATNTFSFSQAHAFGWFMKSLNYGQRNKIARLHLDIDVFAAGNSWLRAVSKGLIKTLRSLALLQVSLEIATYRPPGDHYAVPLMDCLLTFCKTPLSQHQVIVGDYEEDHGYWNHTHKHTHSLSTQFINPWAGFDDETAAQFPRLTRLEKRGLACCYETRFRRTQLGLDYEDPTAEISRKMALEEDQREALRKVQEEKSLSIATTAAAVDDGGVADREVDGTIKVSLSTQSESDDVYSTVH
ncbi:MAG: hypothetical protein Q9218_006485 [Villophora microphyllina]